MAKISLVDNFRRKFTASLPDADKDNVFRIFEFSGKFKLYPSTPESVANLKRIQDEKGLKGFLEEVMVGCEIIKPNDAELVDENDQEISPLEWVRAHLIVQQDAVTAFWEVVNKGVEEKNLKRSRAR